ncbi:MAG: HAMP domain-containing sensor histidine kinase [Pseudomonadota bacterium]
MKSLSHPATPFVESLVLVTWLCAAAIASLLTGGPTSPALALFALGPLAACGIGRVRLAVEALIFAGLAVCAMLILHMVGVQPYAEISQNARAWIGVAAILASAIGGLLALSLAPGPAAERPKPVQTPPQPAPTGLIPPDIADDAPLLWVETNMLGHVRALRGDRRLLPGVSRQRALQDVAAANADDSFKDLVSDAGARTMNLTDGRTLIAHTRPSPTGSVVVFADASNAAQTQLEEMRERVEDAEKALAGRSEFYASLGHELKTPLNAILGFSDMMREEVLGPMPKAYADYAALINESGQDLLLLVEDILDLSKAEANRQRLELEPVDLTASGAAVVRQLSAMAKRAGVVVRMSEKLEAWAHADARAVRQIWQNLISNAIKYSEKGGAIVLKTAMHDDTVSLYVADAGVGMSAEDLAQIAEPFAQGKNAKGRAGTGLGLTVVQRFAELHGGKVVIDTALGKGTTVQVTLPAADLADLVGFEDAAQ